MATYARLQDTIDAAAFDVDALAFDLAFEDADAIVELVRRTVAFEPYDGLLRGPTGTWLARAGNALDQAVLTARLLGDAGYDVQVALVDLAPAAARYVADGAHAPSLPAPLALADTGVDRDELVADDDLLGQAAASALEVRRDLEARVAATSAWLLASLDAAGVAVAEQREDAGTAASLASYAWVQYRLGPSDVWTDAHPALDVPASWAAALTPGRVLEGDVPPDLPHRLRLEAFLERRVGDEVEVRPIMAPWERPVANLAGVPIAFDVLGDGLAIDAVAAFDVDQAAADTTFYFTLLDGVVVPDAEGFDRLGNLLSPAEATSAAAGLFSTLGGLGNEATQALGGGGIELTSVWFTYTFVRPGGEEVDHRRALFDRVPPEDRAAGVVGELAEFDERALRVRCWRAAPTAAATPSRSGSSRKRRSRGWRTAR